jgi:7-carboxy-7-deazaguanine synthase
MKISEVFYSLQGEGARAGEPSVFVRLQGCSAKGACYASGVMCDTEFESGKFMWTDRVLADVAAFPCKWIIWTGGEPADQLRAEDVELFKRAGYRQAIETSGLKPVPPGLDHITVSPKVAEHVLAKNFPLRDDGTHVDELRYVRHEGQEIPEPVLKAHYYYLSPHFDGITANEGAIRHCVTLCLKNPRWRFSLQQHKFWKVL